MKKSTLFFLVSLFILLMACDDNATIVPTRTENMNKKEDVRLQRMQKNRIIPALSFVNNVFLSKGQRVATKGSSTNYSEENIAYIKDIKYQDGSPLLKLVCLKKGGYILLNNTNIFKNLNVLYFSEGKFDENNINPGLIQYIEEFVNNYETEIEKNATKTIVTKGNGSLYHFDTEEPEQTYRVLLSTTSKVVEETNPLLTTNWHQHSPFNKSCPIINGKNALVGCVAIATGQIMNYHKRNLQKIYDWDKINTDTPTTNDLADFLYDIGRGVGMEYGLSESGSTMAKASVYFLNCGYWTSKEKFNFNKTKQQIVEQKYPVYLSGYAERTNRFLGLIYEYTEGHAWVADGYKKIECTETVKYVTEKYGEEVSSYITEEQKTIEFLHMNLGGGKHSDSWVTYSYDIGGYKLKNKEETGGGEYKYEKNMMICTPIK